MKPSTLILAMTLAFSVQLARAGTEHSDGFREVIRFCTACHGQDGNSIQPQFPRLAGQMPAYLEAQLQAFKDRKRDDPAGVAFMYGPASSLDEALTKEISEYFSGQTPTRDDPADPLIVSAGQSIFKNGIPGRGVPACAGCHGNEGQGVATFPRIASQHADCLIDQLTAFKDGFRAYAPMMPDIAKKLAPEEIEAVSVYLSSQ